MRNRLQLRITSPSGTRVQTYEEQDDGSYFMISDLPLGPTYPTAPVTGEGIPTRPHVSIPTLAVNPPDPQSLAQQQGGIQIGHMVDNLPPTPGG